MKKHNLFRFIIIGVLLVIVSLIVVSCSSSTETSATPTKAPAAATEAPAVAPEPTSPPEPELEGSAIRGGQLYDKWWAVSAGGEDAEHSHEDHEHAGGAPESDHPLWATQTNNSRSGADTWRCKECHGWDYKGVDGAYGSGSHMTGFPGIFASKDKPASEILAAMKGSTNPDHDFSTVMDDQDLIDIALFVTTAVNDDASLVSADKSSTGDQVAGKELFNQVCQFCHGPDGNAINFHTLGDPEFVAHVSGDNPWEFLHKVRFGAPGWPMPSGITNRWTEQNFADVLAYAQTLPPEAALSGGGQLYDNWWEVLGADAPTEDNPLWASQSTNERNGADTWRCKECHGWDYMGADGVYGSGSHATGFPGILDAASMSSADLLAWLSGGQNPDHDFSDVMDEVALNALVTFIQKEMTDITPFINADATVNGDPAHGKDLFTDTCVNCHGIDGKKINFHSADDPEYFGTVASDNPWEFFNKASFGQPGVPMPAGAALGWSMQDRADLLAYAQTLPTE